MPGIDYSQKIPNNDDLASDKKLQRALEAWQPNYLDWCNSVGPSDFNTKDVYLRTAVDVGSDGWAHFGYVQMPEYRWGIFLADPEQGRTIGFGDHLGEPVWNEIPGEYRTPLRRLIVTQGDTEPASVEQQRLLGRTCPSLYDLRNLFQVNVEEGRHLWAMAYLLHTYFGRDGREEADALLQRRSGDPDKPRILQAFNEPMQDWLSFLMFTTFTDRDGKYQLLALAESAFDPLARTCRFMLTEEAHHMFVGQTGVARIIQRTAELVRAGKDPEREGALSFALLQRYINYWYSVSLDLFGAEVSTNGAGYFGSGLKGRPKEGRYADHLLLDGATLVEQMENGLLVQREVAPRLAVNLEVRNAYAADCQNALDKWNKLVEDLGVVFRLPSDRFHRAVGTFAGHPFDPNGQLIGADELNRRTADWLPSAADRAYVQSLMTRPVTGPGQFASWIAPPARGIDGKPVDFTYVRFNQA